MEDANNEGFYLDEDFEEDFDDGTAECPACGFSYCTCCGCDCWMDDFDD